MIPVLEQGLYGCVTRDGYTQTAEQSATRMPALRGRPRYRLRDTRASYVVNITMEMSDAQFSYWQTFWASLRHGTDPFEMTLMMDAVLVYNSIDEVYTVQARGPWTSSLSPAGRWVVSLTVEVPSDIQYSLTQCDVIWAGPIDDPAVDDIWAGPITDPAEDVIVPCVYVIDPISEAA